MPLYEYECKSCDQIVELLVRTTGEKLACPDCGSAGLDRVLSVTASPNVRGNSSLPVTAGGEPCSMPRCCGGGCQM